MIRLFQLALADVDDIGKILANLAKQLRANAALTEEEPIQWILVLPSTLLQGGEFLYMHTYGVSIVP